MTLDHLLAIAEAQIAANPPLRNMRNIEKSTLMSGETSVSIRDSVLRDTCSRITEKLEVQCSACSAPSGLAPDATPQAPAPEPDRVSVDRPQDTPPAPPAPLTFAAQPSPPNALQSAPAPAPDKPTKPPATYDDSPRDEAEITTVFFNEDHTIAEVHRATRHGSNYRRHCATRAPPPAGVNPYRLNTETGIVPHEETHRVLIGGSCPARLYRQGEYVITGPPPALPRPALRPCLRSHPR